jgi:hypothetical protein
VALVILVHFRSSDLTVASFTSEAALLSAVSGFGYLIFSLLSLEDHVFHLAVNATTEQSIGRIVSLHE